MGSRLLALVVLLAVVIGVSIAPVEPAGPCAIFHDYTQDPRVTATNLTTSFRTVAQTNMIWSCLDDYSGDISQMGTTTDPYPSGSPSLATTGQGELERLRFVLKKITGWSQWYAHTESFTLSGDTAPALLLKPSGANNAQLWLRHGSVAVNSKLISDISQNLDIHTSDTFAARFTGGRVFTLGTTVATGAAAGDIVQVKNAWLRQVNKDGTGTVRLLTSGGGAGADYTFLSGDGQQTRVGDGLAPSAQFEVKSQSDSRVGLVVDTQALATASAAQITENGVSRFVFDSHTGVAGAPLTLPPTDTGSGQYGRYVSVGRNNNSSNGAGFVRLQSRLGTEYNLWVDATGALRFGTSAPTNANDAKPGAFSAGPIAGWTSCTRASIIVGLRYAPALPAGNASRSRVGLANSKTLSRSIARSVSGPGGCGPPCSAFTPPRTRGRWLTASRRA